MKVFKVSDNEYFAVGKTIVRYLFSEKSVLAEKVNYVNGYYSSDYENELREKYAKFKQQKIF